MVNRPENFWLIPYLHVAPLLHEGGAKSRYLNCDKVMRQRRLPSVFKANGLIVM